MFEKRDKRRLYQLIDLFLEKKIDVNTFCDEFYYCYDLELEDKLTTKEEEKFNELSMVTSRFSEFEEDHKLDSRAFTTEEQIRTKALEVKQSLTKVT